MAAREKRSGPTIGAAGAAENTEQRRSAVERVFEKFGKACDFPTIEKMTEEEVVDTDMWERFAGYLAFEVTTSTSRRARDSPRSIRSSAS